MKKQNGFREFLRRRLVTLKRKPQTIPMLVLLASFLLYSLNLSNISNTTAKIQGPGMGLCGFVTMLFSILSFVCFLNAFPRRKKINVPMLVLTFLMLGAIIFCDSYYYDRIYAAVTRPENPVVISLATKYILTAYNLLNTHRILLGIAAVLTALVPVYGKWLKKINTSIEVDDNGAMGAIDISGEE